MSLKGEKIHETFDDFLSYHPELEVQLDDYGNIYSITFPPEAEKTSFTNMMGDITVYYVYKGEEIIFPLDNNP